MPARKMPAAAKKRQKGHNRKRVERSNDADLEELRTGLYHLKYFKCRKKRRALKRRLEKACGRVLGVDPGAIDAMTVARDDDPENSFHVSSIWWYVIIMDLFYSTS
jgi:hypothetical protein